MRISGIEVRSGALIPRGYGFAYQDWSSDCAVFYPIPINVVVYYWRKLVDWSRLGLRDQARVAYLAGFKAGRASYYEDVSKNFEARFGHKLGDFNG